MRQNLQCIFRDCRPRRIFKGVRGWRKHIQMVHGQSALFDGVDTTPQFEEVAEPSSSDGEQNHNVEPMDIVTENTPDVRDNETVYYEGKGLSMTISSSDLNFFTI